MEVKTKIQKNNCLRHSSGTPSVAGPAFPRPLRLAGRWVTAASSAGESAPLPRTDCSTLQWQSGSTSARTFYREHRIISQNINSIFFSKFFNFLRSTCRNSLDAAAPGWHYKLSVLLHPSDCAHTLWFLQSQVKVRWSTIVTPDFNTPDVLHSFCITWRNIYNYFMIIFYMLPYCHILTWTSSEHEHVNCGDVSVVYWQYFHHLVVDQSVVFVFMWTLSLK